MANSRKAQKHKRNHLERQKVRSGRAATIAARHTARRRSARQKRISAQTARSKVRFWIYPHMGTGGSTYLSYRVSREYSVQNFGMLSRLWP